MKIVIAQELDDFLKSLILREFFKYSTGPKLEMFIYQINYFKSIYRNIVL